MESKEIRVAQIVRYGLPEREYFVLERSKRYPDEIKLYPVKHRLAGGKAAYPFWCKIDEVKRVDA